MVARGVLVTVLLCLHGCTLMTPPAAPRQEPARVPPETLAGAATDAPAPAAVQAAVAAVAPAVPVGPLPAPAPLREALAPLRMKLPWPVTPHAEAMPLPARQDRIARLCHELGNTLGSVSSADCHAQGLRDSGHDSVQQRALALRDFAPAPAGAAQSRILILGGIHGDEYSSISIMFRWMELLQEDFTGDFHWRFLPAVNPDGLLEGDATRQNANGVDLNRNFPSADWSALALDYWERETGRNPRRYPGSGPASEPEVRWVVRQVEEFRPDVIVSVHAPYHLLDFDGPSEAPEKIGELYLHQLGVYPGSLGNYGGVDLSIPVVTLELASAGIMPSRAQIASMWRDLVAWLREREDKQSSSS